MAKKREKKEKPAPQDGGLTAADRKKLHRAVRLVWSWSSPPRLVRKRCMGKDGFPRCESPTCSARGRKVPKVFVDHIEPVGEVGGPDYISRMWCPSSRLQGLCKKCHDAKTKAEKLAAEDLGF